MPSVKNQDKRDMDGIIGNVNEDKTIINSFLLHWKNKWTVGVKFQILEREGVPSL